jgi:hypothetical protein
VPGSVILRTDVETCYFLAHAVRGLEYMKHFVTCCQNPLTSALPQTLRTSDYDGRSSFERKGSRQVGSKRSQSQLHPALTGSEAARVRKAG